MTRVKSKALSPLEGERVGRGGVNEPLNRVNGSGSPPSRGTRKIENKAPYGAARHFPQGGKIIRA
jgi:hypothetical protein